MYFSFLYFLFLLVCLAQNAGDTSQQLNKNEASLISQNETTQNLSPIAGLPLYSAMEVSSPKTPSSHTPSHPIPKLTSFREATRGLDSSSVVSTRVTSQEKEKKKRCEEIFEEYDIIEVPPLSGSHSVLGLTPFGETTRSYEFSSPLTRCVDSSKEGGKRLTEDIIEEYDIIDVAPFTDSHYTPKLMSFKQTMAQRLGGCVVVSKCVSNPEDFCKNIAEEYEIIDLSPPKEITL